MKGSLPSGTFYVPYWPGPRQYPDMWTKRQQMDWNDYHGLDRVQEERTQHSDYKSTVFTCAHYNFPSFVFLDQRVFAEDDDNFAAWPGSACRNRKELGRKRPERPENSNDYVAQESVLDRRRSVQRTYDAL
jgi:hypothetical protein